MGDHGAAVAVNKAGVQRTLVVLPHHGFNPIVSPDGRWVSYRRDNGVYAIRSNGTGNRRLVFGPAQPLAWAPDSRSVLLVAEGRPLTIVHVADGAARSLEKGDDWGVYSAIFSPDGRYVLVSDWHGWRLLHTSNGAQRHFVASPCPNNVQLAWSPDGQRIAMICDTGFHPGPSITVLTIATRRVTHLGDTHTTIPIWLTNNTVLTERFIPHPRSTELRTYNLAGHLTGAQPLTSPLDLITAVS